MRYVFALAVAITVNLYILSGCATRPCTMDEWATRYDCK